jgi:hypothetical protein
MRFLKKIGHVIAHSAHVAEIISHCVYCTLVFAFAHGPYAYAALPVALFAIINLFADGE